MGIAPVLKPKEVVSILMNLGPTGTSLGSRPEYLEEFSNPNAPTLE